MSRGINATLSSKEALEVAEETRKLHFLVACNNDVNIANCRTDIYKASKRMFVTAIKTAYPHMNAERVYLMWVDCMESIEYCVDYIRSNNRYPF